jgi:hypothetical protein
MTFRISCWNLIFFAVASIAAPDARAVHCKELFDGTENGPYLLSVAELLPTDERKISLPTENGLELPQFSGDRIKLGFFESASDASFRLYTAEGLRLRSTSEVPPVQGFHSVPRTPVTRPTTLAAYAREMEQFADKIMPATDHLIVVETPRNMNANVIRLASTEAVAGARRLDIRDKPYAIVITTDRTAAPGFTSRSAIHSVSVYLVSDTGHQRYRFYLSDKDAAPKVRMTVGEDYGVVLKVDDRSFQILALPRSIPQLDQPIHLPELKEALKKQKRNPPAIPGTPQASADLLFPMRK